MPGAGGGAGAERGLQASSSTLEGGAGGAGGPWAARGSGAGSGSGAGVPAAVCVCGGASEEAESPCPERLRAIDAVLAELVTPRAEDPAGGPAPEGPPPQRPTHPASFRPRAAWGRSVPARRRLGLSYPPELARAVPPTDSAEGGRAEAGLEEALPGGATSCGSGPAVTPGCAPPTSPPSSSFGAGDSHLFPMAVLDFDLCPAFGPAVGLSRLQRLGRARALGLNPPTLAGGESGLRGCAWEGLL